MLQDQLTMFWMGLVILFLAAFVWLVSRSRFREATRESEAARVARRVDPLPEVVQRAATGARFARGEKAQPVLPVSEPAKAAVGPADDLTRIKLIDVAIQARLNELGVNRYEQRRLDAGGRGAHHQGVAAGRPD